MQGSKIIKVTVSTVGNVEKQINVPDTLTGYQLKQYIYQNVTQSLPALEMKLYYAGVKIQDNKKLESYKMIQSSQIKVIQMKAQLDQIAGLIVSYQRDPISDQKKTVRMACGHVVGRDCMTQFIRSLVQGNQFKIVCPASKPNGDPCECQWDYKMCRKIGVFTKQEIQQFQIGLSKNWILQNAIQCPNCRQNLYKGDLKQNRVKCPKCKYVDFCCECLKKWKGTGNDICGNQGCKVVQAFLEKSPWTKIFKLYDSNKKALQVKAPVHRACPKCMSIIQHIGGCKHVGCINCKNNFCWICLDSLEGKSWKCGGPFDYCGKIQPTQKINN